MHEHEVVIVQTNVMTVNPSVFHYWSYSFDHDQCFYIRVIGHWKLIFVVKNIQCHVSQWYKSRSLFKIFLTKSTGHELYPRVFFLHFSDSKFRMLCHPIVYSLKRCVIPAINWMTTLLVPSKCQIWHVLFFSKSMPPSVHSHVYLQR